MCQTAIRLQRLRAQRTVKLLPPGWNFLLVPRLNELVHNDQRDAARARMNERQR